VFYAAPQNFFIQSKVYESIAFLFTCEQLFVDVSILEEIFLVKFYNALSCFFFYKLWLSSDLLLPSSTLGTSVVAHSTKGISDEA
jgi:hypothetical protein